MKKFQFFSLSSFSGLLFSIPFTTFAQVNDVFGLATLAYNILARLGSLFWILAVMLFVWGIVKFIGNANDAAARTQGKQFIMWGLIAFVVLTSLWGIVNLILYDTLNITPGGQVQYVDKTGNIVN